MNIIQPILEILVYITLISFTITFCYAIYILMQRGFNNNLIEMIAENKYFGYSLFLTVISFVSIFSLFSMKTKIYRENITEIFSSYNSSKDKLYVNNIDVKNDSLIFILKNIEKISDGRNTGKTEINIKLLKNNKPKYIMLLRDFRYPKKYWVYLKQSEIDKKGICIGEINTNQFDEIEKITKKKQLNAYR